MLLFILTYVTGVMGSLIKPTVMVVIIAVTLLELIGALRRLKTCWKQSLIKIAVIFCVALLYKGAQSYLYDATGYVQNKEVSATYHHYLLMGMNEETTSSYFSGDLAFLGSFDTREERIPAQTALTLERLQEKGFFGYFYFLLRKMVMTFNDGAFGWGREGAFTLNSYPVLSEASYADTLKNIFWPSIHTAVSLIPIVR